jgi:CRP-like cAMP-binding protein
MAEPILQSKLLTFIESIMPLSEHFKEKIASKLVLKKVKKGDVIIKSEMVCDSLFFIRSGFVRGYYPYKGKDITLWINTSGEILGSGRPILEDSVSQETIEAIDDCEFEVMLKRDVRELLASHYEVVLLMNYILSNYYADASDRALMSKIPNAKQRYEFFLQSRYGRLANEVPLKYIASFLGLRNETLSRIRGNR